MKSVKMMLLALAAVSMMVSACSGSSPAVNTCKMNAAKTGCDGTKADGTACVWKANAGTCSQVTTAANSCKSDFLNNATQCPIGDSNANPQVATGQCTWNATKSVCEPTACTQPAVGATTCAVAQTFCTYAAPAVAGTCS